jgi:hypothetical protein
VFKCQELYCAILMENKQKCCGNLFLMLSVAVGTETTGIYEYLYNVSLNFISFIRYLFISIFHFGEIT